MLMIVVVAADTGVAAKVIGKNLTRPRPSRERAVIEYEELRDHSTGANLRWLYRNQPVGWVERLRNPSPSPDRR
jgi:hypothetical protein